MGVQFFSEGQGCCEVPRAITTALGEPFNLIPAEMMNFGKAGVVGWGSLCGALNGAAALGSFCPQSAGHCNH